MIESSSVALAALGVLATSIGLMAWVVKKVLGDVAPALNNHTEAAQGLREAVEKNTDVSNQNKEVNEEMLIFMRKLNGKLPRLVEEKIEQAEQE